MQTAIDWAGDPANGCELVKVSGRVINIKGVDFKQLIQYNYISIFADKLTAHFFTGNCSGRFCFVYLERFSQVEFPSAKFIFTSARSARGQIHRAVI